MDIIQMAREMGKEIQGLSEYKKMMAAKEKNDNDQDLQAKIGEFNLLRMDINNEIQKPERDEERLATLDKEIKACHAMIMGNQSMIEYQEAKNAVDSLMNDVMSILSMCVNGEDPDTCQTESSCGGSCSSCSGCH
jgi:cell fate (sporulation/competence/biofilm development) regulator YlbF (YheA/YmcA/DUF963 family)